MKPTESVQQFTDANVARLYDVLNPWGAGDAFFLDLVMSAESVLDVGCGTGSILKRARREEHSGRLVGIDPDREMLSVAREHDGIDWHEAKAADLGFPGEFELAIMTGHAFQCLITDDDVRASLVAIAGSLAPGEVFAFDSRNPATQEWLAWDAMAPMEVVDPAGRALAIDYDVLDVTGDVVTLTENTSLHDGTRLRTDRGQLRFLAPDRLGRFLAEAGFKIAAQYGNWDRTPFGADSADLITLARKGDAS